MQLNAAPSRWLPGAASCVVATGVVRGRQPLRGATTGATTSPGRSLATGNRPTDGRPSAVSDCVKPVLLTIGLFSESVHGAHETVPSYPGKGARVRPHTSDKAEAPGGLRSNPWLSLNPAGWFSGTSVRWFETRPHT